MLKIGDKAPDFTLTSDEGKEVSLKNFKGQRVLLYFYPEPARPAAPSKPVNFATLNPNSIRKMSSFSASAPIRKNP